MSYCEDYIDPFPRDCEHGVPDGINCDDCVDEAMEDDDEDWECAVPDKCKCLMPSPLHHRSECYTVEDAEAYYAEIKESMVDIQIVPDPEHPHLIEVWEPLPTKAPNPSIAQPYCCYGNTVIFYVRPYVVRPWHYYWICNGKRRAEKPGGSYQEWDRIETTLRIDAIIEHEGQRFRCCNGRVVWKHKRWWMKREARRI